MTDKRQDTPTDFISVAEFFATPDPAKLREMFPGAARGLRLMADVSSRAEQSKEEYRRAS